MANPSLALSITPRFTMYMSATLNGTLRKKELTPYLRNQPPMNPTATSTIGSEVAFLSAMVTGLIPLSDVHAA